jgi:putative modified peptide
MANGKKGPKMDHKVVKRLLDGLSTDEGFRKKFQEDPAGTLDSIGYQAPTDDTEMAAGQCLTLQANQSLAPAEEIARDREKIESLMSGIFGFIGTTGLTR